ncbi:hypothetical protein MMC25_001660 [Agyrium rufum]|nr:hypothetical protein [Agyrium rufum]
MTLTKAASLSNPLVTLSQVSNSATQLDGVPPELEASLRYTAAKLTQAAGILLKQPQETIAQAIVTLMRFYSGPEGGSLMEHGIKDMSAASLYLHAKLSFNPISPRSLLLVYVYLESPVSPFSNPLGTPQDPNAPPPEPLTYHLSEGRYLSLRNSLFANEMHLLCKLSFTTQVSLPHNLALTYLQTLSALPTPPTSTSRALAKRTIEHLNAALFSPQQLYLTHQPNALAVAAIYLAARETKVKLPGVEWWEVFDVDREELGFLVVGLRSLEGWARREDGQWKERGIRVPLTVGELEDVQGE